MIATERLELVSANVEMLRAAIEGREALAEALGADVPESWPPEYLDAAALQYTIDRLAEGAFRAEWQMYFVVLRRGPNSRLLVGGVGYKGPPDADGSVEVGYGIVQDHRRRGYGTEATLGLVDRAFAVPEVKRITAETYPELAASRGVLAKCGFRRVGEGSEPGVIRFELTREEWSRKHDIDN